MTAKLTQPVGISSLARLLEACPGLGGVGCNTLPKNRYISPAVPHPRAEPWRAPLTPGFPSRRRTGRPGLRAGEGPPHTTSPDHPAESGEYPVILFPDRKSTRLNSSHRCISYAVL